ncbi:hypothetical protein WR25_16243 [Diploscapter pachys]|uniref:CX domain-containing protein n=1 Tax=Diploscapter pachys TaxID=2018661 RepID=A0A2A2KNK5_9BILA|nr:hypothetical protein WR25_16243 [Diploscapter pachys]
MVYLKSQESFNKKFRESVFSATSNGLIKTGPDTYVVRNGRNYFNHGSNVYYFGADYNLRNVNPDTQMCRFVFDTDLRGDKRTSENYLKHDSMGTIHGDAFRTSISEENFGEIKLENGTQIRELSFECKLTQRCCQLQCCDQTYETLHDDEKEKDGGFSLGFNIGIDFLIFIATLILLCLGMRIAAAIHSNMDRSGWSSLSQRDSSRLEASQVRPWSQLTQNSAPIQYPACPSDPQTRIIRPPVPLSRRSPSPDQTRQVNSQNPPPIYFEQSPRRSLSPNPDENVTYDDPPPMYIEPPPSYEDCVSQK